MSALVVWCEVSKGYRGYVVGIHVSLRDPFIWRFPQTLFSGFYRSLDGDVHSTVVLGRS